MLKKQYYCIIEIMPFSIIRNAENSYFYEFFDE